MSELDKNKYELEYPIKDEEGKERTYVTKKGRVKGADLLILDEHKGEQAQALALIGRMFQLSKYEVEQLDQADIVVMSDMLSKN